MQCFSQQAELNKCFRLKPEKNLTQILAVVFEKIVQTALLRRTPITNNAMSIK